MVSQKVIVKNPSGLHARPAVVFSKVAAGCTSNVIIHYKNKQINPKSVLMIMAAAIASGAEIEIECTGENEEHDLQILVAAVESGLGE